MQSIKIRLLAIFTFIVVLPAFSHSFFGSSSGSYSSLSELTNAIAKEMKSDFDGRRLYMDREEIRDEQDDSHSIFSVLMANELERSLSRAGFVFEGQILDRAKSDEEHHAAELVSGLTDYKIFVSYRRVADKVQVYVKIRDNKQNNTVKSLKNNYEMAIAKLPPETFADTLDNRILKLASKFTGGWQRKGQLTVYVAPVIESRKKYSSPFAEYVTRKIKTLLSGRHNLKVIEENPDLHKLYTDRIVKKPTFDTLMSEEYAGAESILVGNYLRSMQQTVHLDLTLKDASGKVMKRSEDDIPYDLIQYSMDNDAAETLSQITDIEHEAPGGVIKISTNKGGNYQIFREGETIQFILQVTKSLYLYVYNITPKGEVNLLYPKEGEVEVPKTQGIIYTIPDNSDSWEIKVEPPFGTDAVKVFASNRKLPMPTVSTQTSSRSFQGGARSQKPSQKVQGELASQKVINGHDLVDWYKGVAAKNRASLFESSVYIETRGK